MARKLALGWAECDGCGAIRKLDVDGLCLECVAAAAELVAESAKRADLLARIARASAAGANVDLLDELLRVFDRGDLPYDVVIVEIGNLAE